MVIRRPDSELHKKLLKLFTFYAVDMNWLPATVIPRRQWPAIHYKEKHAVTHEEHQRIIAAEVNPERKTLYQLCWHLGASPGGKLLTEPENRPPSP